jgi:hypothetical protein
MIPFRLYARVLNLMPVELSASRLFYVRIILRLHKLNATFLANDTVGYFCFRYFVIPLINFPDLFRMNNGFLMLLLGA